MSPTASPALAAIEAVVAAHDPADPDEARDVARVRELLRATPAPLARDQHTPGHLTASAVVVDPERTRTLLVFHEKLARWLQPGGHLEPGEADPAEAARREALEETELETAHPEGGPRLLDVDVHAIPARRDEPAHEHFDLRFLVVAAPGEARPGDGTAAVRWAAPEELGGLGLDPGLRRALAKVAWRGGSA